MKPYYCIRPVLLILLTLFGKVSVSIAHEVRPAYLEIDEMPNTIHVLWKQPTMGEIGIRINPEMSSLPLIDSLAKTSAAEIYLIKEWNFDSSNNALNHCTITIRGLESTITDVLVRITYKDGNVV